MDENRKRGGRREREGSSLLSGGGAERGVGGKPGEAGVQKAKWKKLSAGSDGWCQMENEN